MTPRERMENALDEAFAQGVCYGRGMPSGMDTFAALKAEALELVPEWQDSAKG